jgi:hypothetical protein
MYWSRKCFSHTGYRGNFFSVLTITHSRVGKLLPKSHREYRFYNDRCQGFVDACGQQGRPGAGDRQVKKIPKGFGNL